MAELCDGSLVKSNDNPIYYHVNTHDDAQQLFCMFNKMLTTMRIATADLFVVFWN